MVKVSLLQILSQIAQIRPRFAPEYPPSPEKPEADRDSHRAGGGTNRLGPKQDKFEVHHAAHDLERGRAPRRHAEKRGTQPNETVFINISGKQPRPCGAEGLKHDGVVRAGMLTGC